MVTLRTANPPCAGSIPARASSYCPGGGMVYAEDLKSSDFGHVGSTPTPGTRIELLLKHYTMLFCIRL